MKETSARLLRLLTLLQTRRHWAGHELADRLGVTTRTLRRDVDKLRDLDYPVHATSGTAGGYRLGPGTTLPPLLLDDDEAVAVAVALRTAAGSGVATVGETALRALVKLEQLLPARLRHRVAGLRVARIDTPGLGPFVDPAALTAIASAVRDHQRLRLDYRTHDAAADQRREVEPHHMVSWGRRWYLVAWDLGRADWRIFRVDRIRPRTPAGPRFTPRPLPGGDPATFVTDRIARHWPFQATLRLHAPADHPAVRDHAPYGRLEPVDEHSCRLEIGAESPAALAFLLAGLEIDFTVESSIELAKALRRVATRFQHAVSDEL